MSPFVGPSKTKRTFGIWHSAMIFIYRSGCVVMVAAVLVGLVTLSMFNRSEPFIGQIRKKIGVVIVGFESIKDNKVGPEVYWGIAIVDSFKQIIIDNVKLWTNFVGANIADETYSSGVYWGCAHVLATA